jgi:hypothetical protein
MNILTRPVPFADHRIPRTISTGRSGEPGMGNGARFRTEDGFVRGTRVSIDPLPSQCANPQILRSCLGAPPGPSAPDALRKGANSHHWKTSPTPARLRESSPTDTIFQEMILSSSALGSSNLQLLSRSPTRLSSGNSCALVRCCCESSAALGLT